MRLRLPELDLPPEREAEVAEELAQLLADAGAAAGVDLDSADEVDAFVRRQVPDWNHLGHAVGLAPEGPDQIARGGRRRALARRRQSRVGALPKARAGGFNPGERTPPAAS